MSTEHPDEAGHGDTVAAWTSVVVLILGFSGMVLFFYIGDLNLTFASIAVILIGAIAGPVLSRLGFGKKR
ncbi:MAG: hypothetical protein F2529_02160 [Actinobacteria bacterium]|uniref:Unannotated protein n=1 Tax=freshwater metagenome TaxID=449393 RepID=A0A6J6BKY9_9ZZZZ|nr:hypothetical protein [Actinomycetota bacterium]